MIAAKRISFYLQMVVVVYVVLWFSLVSRIVNIDFNGPIIFWVGLVFSEKSPYILGQMYFYKTLLVWMILHCLFISILLMQKILKPYPRFIFVIKCPCSGLYLGYSVLAQLLYQDTTPWILWYNNLDTSSIKVSIQY